MRKLVLKQGCLLHNNSAKKMSQFKNSSSSEKAVVGLGLEWEALIDIWVGDGSRVGRRWSRVGA